MKIITPELLDYSLIDSGNSQKLEQIGNNIIARPDTNCIWKKQKSDKTWTQTTATCKKSNFGRFHWTKLYSFKDPWLFTYKHTTPDNQKHSITLKLRYSHSKNIGVFPEQAGNWGWMMDIISKQQRQPSILNLFAYTGGASLCAASAGAKVCHVDASKSAVTWAKQNQQESKISNNSIRWIVDDCTKFVAREIKRGNSYDGIIMDPPAFGRDPKGNVFEFEKEIFELLRLCKQIVNSKPLFFIFNGYSMGYSSTVLKNVLLDFFPNRTIEYGELQLKEKSDRTLPCSLFARF